MVSETEMSTSRMSETFMNAHEPCLITALCCNVSLTHKRQQKVRSRLFSTALGSYVTSKNVLGPLKSNTETLNHHKK
jgi:hypothetical protein